MSGDLREMPFQILHSARAGSQTNRSWAKPAEQIRTPQMHARGSGPRRYIEAKTMGALAAPRYVWIHGTTASSRLPPPFPRPVFFPRHYRWTKQAMITIANIAPKQHSQGWALKMLRGLIEWTAAWKMAPLLRIRHHRFDLIAKDALNSRGIHGRYGVKIIRTRFYGAVVVQSRRD